MSHYYSNNYVHAVYSTKDRKDLIPMEFEKRLYSFIASIARGHKIPLLAAGGMPNHSHLLFLLPATISLASAINIFKTNSSRFLHDRGLVFQWQNGYGAFSVSISQLDQGHHLHPQSARAPQEDEVRRGVPDAIKKGWRNLRSQICVGMRRVPRLRRSGSSSN